MDKIAICTVVYNNYSMISGLYESLDKQSSDKFKVFVTDNSEEKQQIPKREYSQVLDGENNGYAGGINNGVRAALQEGFSYFVVINDDTEVAKDFVERAIKAIKKNPASLIGGKIYYFPGHEFHTDRYKQADEGKVLWYAGGDVDWEHAFVKHRGVDEVDAGQYDSEGETEFVTGCLMVFDKDLIDRVGLMDEKYFLYYEDADWNERVKRAGLKVRYDPSLVIWHKNSQSSGGSGSKLHQSYQEKNRLRFGLRFAPLRTKLHLIKNYFLYKMKS